MADIKPIRGRGYAVGWVVDVVFGQGQFGRQCVLCGRSDYRGPLEHRPDCPAERLPTQEALFAACRGAEDGRAVVELTDSSPPLVQITRAEALAKAHWIQENGAAVRDPEEAWRTHPARDRLVDYAALLLGVADAAVGGVVPVSALGLAIDAYDNAKVDKLERERDELQASLEDANVLKAALAAERDELKAALARHRQATVDAVARVAYEEVRIERDELKTKHDEVLGHYDGLQQECAELERERDELKARLAGAEASLATSMEYFDIAHQRRLRVEKLLDLARADATELRGKLDDMLEHVKFQDRLIDSLKAG